MTIVRYFHIRPPQDKNKYRYNGATVRVEGDPGSVGRVLVSVAFCSRRDNYTRSTGRIQAAMAPQKIVALRYLSQELENIEAEVYGEKWEMENKDNFLFALRYFLPKD